VKQSWKALPLEEGKADVLEEEGKRKADWDMGRVEALLEETELKLCPEVGKLFPEVGKLFPEVGKGVREVVGNNGCDVEEGNIEDSIMSGEKGDAGAVAIG